MLSFGLCPGCASSAPPALETELQQFSLVNATTVAPIELAHARIDYDRPLPEHLTRRLCDEFTLVVISRASDFSDLRRRLGLPSGLPTPDFSQGCVIGIIASVGEPANDIWPVRVRHVLTSDGEGSIEADFVPGLYYPLITAGFLDLTYVPGLRSVRVVKVGQRTFLLRSTDTNVLTSLDRG